MKQKITQGVQTLDEILKELNTQRLFLVCGRSFDNLSIREFVESVPVEITRFSGFSPNPIYNEVEDAVALFRRANCDTILAIGGGSAIDVAKCVKLYCKMNPEESYLTQEQKETNVPLVALPTTAGTGSESTHYAVIYVNGSKQSITHPSILPNYAILDPSVLRNLPLYQKKCAMLDALCQAIEAWWSINSTEESKALSLAAVEGILANWETYISENSGAADYAILDAANLAGQAIDITATTAPHAMSYKLTSLYHLPHGHAVAICMPEVWDYIRTHTAECADKRGEAYLKQTIEEIEKVYTSDRFRGLLEALEIGYPHSKNYTADLNALADDVNPVRLKNNPVPLGRDVLYSMYERIVKKDAG